METEAELVGAIRRCRDEGIAIGRLADHQIAHSAYMTDPDGNPLEFYVDTIRDWRRVLQGDVDLITSVWDPEAAAPRTEPMYDPDPTLDRVEAAPLHPVRLSHAVLATANLAAMVRFYVAVAGLEVVDRTAETALLRGRQSAGAFDLALIAAGEGIPEGLHHFAFDLPEGTDVEELAQRLEALGVRIDRVWRGGHKSSLFLADPDGWRIEFLVRSGHGRPVAHAPAGDRAYAL
jgi:catechol 2,3-dioxygenase